MRAVFRWLPVPGYLVAVCLCLLCETGWTQISSNTVSGEIWRTTTPPDWESEASFTAPYPPEENQPEEEHGTAQEGKAPEASKDQAAESESDVSRNTDDPVMRRLNEAYEEVPGGERQHGNRPEASPSLGVALLRAVFALLLVLGLFFLFVKVLNKFRSVVPPGSRASGGLARLAVVDRVPLGMRHTVYLLKVGDRMIVVGTAPGAIMSLAEFPPGNAVQPSSTGAPTTGTAETQNKESDSRAGARFRELLTQALDRMEPKTGETGDRTGKDEANPADRDIDALREDIERLRRFLEESGRDRVGE